ncbi:MAG: hypothetical protein DRJ03_02620 [Chloroflexi bacterium]|nr:MAG: hypothetical protein DRJ03_02620 [Chloroflexota bacterium]
MDFDKAYAVDDDAVINGKWMVTKAGFDVKVAKLNNPAFKAEVVRLQKPHLALLRSTADTEDLVNDITTKAMAKTILLDWKAESKGKEVPYTPELGYEYMTKSSDFREDISVLSVDRENYKPEDVVEK